MAGADATIAKDAQPNLLNSPSEIERADDVEPTAYVCEKAACELPTTDPAVFATQL
jgi:uncharacterized protein YyaL (SSP411 family)